MKEIGLHDEGSFLSRLQGNEDRKEKGGKEGEGFH